MSGDGTVGKALDVLDLVAGFGHPARFSDLLAHSPYPKATLYRLLQTLVRNGCWLSTRTAAPIRLALGWCGWPMRHGTKARLPQSRGRISMRCQPKWAKPWHLAQMDHAQVLYVDKRNARDPIPMYSQAGKVGPAYCTGVGKAMLAYLPEANLPGILSQQSWHAFTAKDHHQRYRHDAGTDLDPRGRGFAFDDEEHEPGIICVAVPILSTGGAVSGRAFSHLDHPRGPIWASWQSLRRALPRLPAPSGRKPQNWRFPEETAHPNRERD